MFFITLFFLFASRSRFTSLPARNTGLETKLIFFFEKQRSPMRMNLSSSDLKSAQSESLRAGWHQDTVYQNKAVWSLRCQEKIVFMHGDEANLSTPSRGIVRQAVNSPGGVTAAFRQKQSHRQPAFAEEGRPTSIIGANVLKRHPVAACGMKLFINEAAFPHYSNPLSAPR